MQSAMSRRCWSRGLGTVLTAEVGAASLMMCSPFFGGSTGELRGRETKIQSQMTQIRPCDAYLWNWSLSVGVRETYARPREAGCAKARAFLKEPADMSEVESWREMPGGGIEFMPPVAARNQLGQLPVRSA